MTEESEKKSGNFVVEYFKSFGVLKETRKEYWGMQVINFIDHTILFAVYTIAVLFFSAGTDKFGFGMADTTAGYVYTIFGSLTTICLFFSGLVSDWLGIRRSMFVNQGVLLFIRTAIVLVTLNQIFFQGDLQIHVHEGQQFCIEDRTGADGVPEVTGGSGRGLEIARQLGLADLTALQLSDQERDDQKIKGALYGGANLAQPEQEPVTSLREVFSRINFNEDNVLKGEEKKVEAKLGEDKQSLLLVDNTDGEGAFTVVSGPGSTAAEDLGIAKPATERPVKFLGLIPFGHKPVVQGEPLFPEGSSTKLATLHDGRGVRQSDYAPDLIITASDGSRLEITLGQDRVPITRGTAFAKLNEGEGIHVVNPKKAKTVSDLLARINHADGNDGKVAASVEDVGENDYRLVLTDDAGGASRLMIQNGPGSTAATDLGMTGEITDGKLVGSVTLESPTWLFWKKKGEGAKLKKVNDGAGVNGAAEGVDLVITASDGTVINVEIGEMPRDIIRITTADAEQHDVDLTKVDSVSALMARFDKKSGGWAWLLIAILFIAQAPFLAIGQTAFQAANKRFTTPRSRSAGFNLWYLFMNVGAALAGILIDYVFIGLDLPRVHIFTVGIATAIVCLFCIGLFVRRQEQLRSPGEENDNNAADNAGADGEVKELEPTFGDDDKKPDEPSLAKDAPKRLSPWQNFLAVAREPVFWRFTCLITLLIPVRSVFLYMHLMMPKFWVRVIGPDAYIGLLTTLNPVLVIIGLILLIPILNKFSVYKMLTYGAIVSGLSLFILAMPPVAGAGWASWWPWLHDNLATIAGFAYIMSFICLVVLTIGEVVWSPRLVEYTAAIAPEGQEGTYLGFSMVPYFLAKTFVSAISGHMLLHWCAPPPEDNPLELRDSIEVAVESGTFTYWDSPWAMWFVLAVPAVGGPLIALLLRRWFTKGAHFKRGEHTE
ncbi:MAG: MFS transporter [Phycisphaerales bacterium]|nr:MAG: MFS transporter [Phycisphaerales bacterium]